MQPVVIAGGALVLDNKILLVRRLDTKKHMPGLWEIPGGKIEEFEDVAACAEREFFEETGLKVKALYPYNVWTHKDGSVFNIEIDFVVGPVQKIKDIKLDENEHSEYTWVAENDIKKIKMTDEMRKTVITALNSL